MTCDLVICEFYLKEAVNMLFRGTIFHVGVCILPHHVIDGVHYFCHLLEEQTEGKKI